MYFRLQLYNSTHYRNKYFLKLSKYKNLKLLSLNSKLNECIKNAKAVVTMNSTSGVESLIRVNLFYYLADLGAKNVTGCLKFKTT